MPRKLKDKDLGTREARSQLKARGKPYWRLIGKGLHLGYRKNRDGGVWLVRHYLGKQKYQLSALKPADDRLEADGTTILDFFQAQDAARSTRPGLTKAGTYTVKDAATSYLESIEGKASHHDVKMRMQAFVLQVLGDRPVMELEASEIRKWHRTIAKTPARRRTGKGQKQAYRKADMNDPEVIRQRKASANRILSHLKAALNHLRSEHPKQITSDDAWRLVKVFENVDVSRAQYLSADQARRLINAAEGDFRVLVQAALQTGARYSELGRLQVRDFNRDTGKLRVRRHKTGTDKYITLTPEGRTFFAQLATGHRGTDLLLGREWGKNHQNALMKAACERAGIDPLPFHQLRHTWASLAIMGGVDRMVVARNLGHADTRMVDKHYGHLSDDFITREIQDKAPTYGLVEPSNIRTIGGAR
jgi:integrase